NRKEQFFSDLHVLIDLFTMGLINYISKTDSKLED
ncbi:MurR/RpiR family transcriptional regulator, partial [Lactiplantibacillus plantarum]